MERLDPIARGAEGQEIGVLIRYTYRPKFNAPLLYYYTTRTEEKQSIMNLNLVDLVHAHNGLP